MRPELTTLELLERRARARGEPKTQLAERYLREGVRMDEHPGIRFVDGALGRRPAVLGTGLDVWEVIETVHDNGGSIDQAAAYLELDPRLVRVAVGYYGSNREEIDAWIERVRDIADEEEGRWRRAHEALA
jgi:uncharacterized protein (DUF433 family)